jgi:hypothetical protein
MFISAHLFAFTMGKKVNIWLNDTSLKIWETIPTGVRSQLIKDAIHNFAKQKQPLDPKIEMINMKLTELANTNAELEQILAKRNMLQHELEQLRSDGVKIKISKEEFWNTLEHRANIYLEHKSVYRSYSGKSAYSIFEVVNNKIYILNKRTGRTFSNFSRKTTDIAIDRLLAHGGKVPVGQFIPVKMHEYTVVALHPNLIEKDGYVCWIDDEIALVTEDMVPEHEGEMPPNTWVSTDFFLAALLDGKKVLIGQGRKIVIFFLEKHPIFTEYNCEDPFQTKYWSHIGPGMLHWGHEGATHKLVTYPSKLIIEPA